MSKRARPTDVLSDARRLQYTKTTIDPEGGIVHVKDKINGTVVTP